jgi:hypothetical protein
MQCIYCNQREAGSSEHYLPRCLGSFHGYSPLTDTICQECNGAISAVERHFCRWSPEGFFRERLGIRGRKRKQPRRVFQPASTGAPFLAFRGKYPGEDFEILWRIDTRNGGVQEVPQLVLFFPDGKSLIVPVPDDIIDSPQLAELLRSAGLTPDRQCKVQVIVPKGDEDRFEYLLAGIGVHVDLEPRMVGPVAGPFSLQGFLGAQYFRAVAKIAFHYALKHSRNFAGYEPEFAGIRDFIINGAGRVDDYVGSGNTDLLIRLPGEKLRGFGHLLTVEADHGNIVTARMQFFMGPDYTPLVWIVALGQNPSRVIWNQRFGHWFAYKNELGKGCDGEMQTVRAIDRSLLP